jgi:crossover junction endodeoxyribonuclease RuvC
MVRERSPQPTPTDTPLTLIGIDPGLQRTGYAVLSADASDLRTVALQEAGVIRLTARESLPARLLELGDALSAVLDRHVATVLALEDLYSNYKHPRTAILMGHARGVIMALCARRGLAVAAIPPTHAKKMLTGNGHASKEQVQRATQATLGLPELPAPNDVADAIAVGLCGLHVVAGQAFVAADGGRP